MPPQTQELVAQTLQWLMFSEIVLKPSTLVQALAVTPGVYYWEPTAVPSEEDVLGLCGSLISKRADGALDFAHFTVREYLESIDVNNTPHFAPFKFSRNEANYLIGCVCLTYLNLDLFSETPLDESALNKLARCKDEGAVVEPETTTVFPDRATTCANIQVPEAVPGLSGLAIVATSKAADTQETQRPSPKQDMLHSFSEWFATDPLMVYAARYWHHHCHDHLSDPLVTAMTHKLFHPEKRQQFIWWSQSLLHLCSQRSIKTYPDTHTLHWASCLALYEVCNWLLQHGVDVNRSSSLGTPYECLLLGITALNGEYENFLPYSRSLSMPSDEKGMTDRAKIAQLFIKGGLSTKDVGCLNIQAEIGPRSSRTPLALALIADPHNERLMSNLLAKHDTEISINLLDLIDNHTTYTSRHAYDSHIPRGYVAFLNAINPENVGVPAQALYQGLVQEIHTCQICSPQHHEPDKNNSILRLLSTERLRDLFCVSASRGQLPSLTASLSILQERHSSEELGPVVGQAMESAVAHAHEHIVQQLLDCGADANRRRHDNVTYLHQCLSDTARINVESTIQITTMLLNHRADLHARNSKGETPIDVAAASNQTGFLRRLILSFDQSRLDSVRSCQAASLLRTAVRRGTDEAVLFLLESTVVHPGCIDKTLAVALSTDALSRRDGMAFCQLFDKGFISSDLDEEGSSLLYRAVALGHLSAVKHIIAAGLRDDSKRRDRCKAIHQAALSSSTNSVLILECLLHMGEDPNMKMNPGISTLHILSRRIVGSRRAGTPSIDTCRKIELVMEFPGIDLSDRDELGRTPAELYVFSLSSLHFWENEHVELRVLNVLRKLIYPGLDLKVVKRSGKGVLHLMCALPATETSFSMVKTLVDLGLELHAGDDEGQTPFEILLFQALRAFELSEEERRRNDPRLKWREDNLWSKLGARYDVVSADKVRLATNTLHYLIGKSLAARLNEPMRDDCGGYSPMTVALKTECSTMIDVLLSKDDVSVDTRSSSRPNLTSLEVAASGGCDMKLAVRLLERSRSESSTLSPINGWSILHFAAIETKEQGMLRALLAHKPELDYDIRTQTGETPLGLAIRWKAVVSVRLLLAAGASVNIAAAAGDVYPIHLAVKTQSFEILQELITHGAHVDKVTECGLTALSMAAWHGHLGLIDLLLRSGAHVSPTSACTTETVRMAAMNGHWQTVEMLLRHGASVNTVLQPWGSSLLHTAVTGTSLGDPRRNWRTAKMLLDFGAVHNLRNLQGHTPFSCVVLDGSWDIAEQFLRSGLHLDVNEILVNGWTAMHIAIYAGALSVVELLLPRTPKAQDIIDDQGRVAGSFLTCAVASGNDQLLGMISGPLDYTFQNDYGWTIAHFAALSDNPKTLLCCKLHGIDWSSLTAVRQTSAGNLSKLSPWHLAAFEGCRETLRFLKSYDLVHDINIRTACESGYTALHLAVLGQREGIVQQLLELGADPLLIDQRERRSAFHMAAERGADQIFSSLMQHLSGKAALSRCENEKAMLHAIRLTQQALSAEDIDAMTPELLAIEKGCQHIVETVDEFESYADETWTLRVKPGSWARKVMTNDYNLYAINNTSCPSELQNMLTEHAGVHVEPLGRPIKGYVLPDTSDLESESGTSDGTVEDDKNTTPRRDPLQKRLDDNWQGRFDR
ncbi:hypothetical protein LTR10_018904 [Elasticomyces elasticus]|uniref:Uncharacterized protein n=1 Tax=Exophiala sideris TaxID=1016849 RepID=A0ABR0JIM0_9EURO|nr:hypothetical protein LTR10_018904 [Elasticomyces elasticus]KAK5034451.1 hypothetical protein LTS07_003372 [Exophiala sideris]KAK5042748.1 hypothetical protein LTR13_001596 [Exophiala sideris]KAK5065831.1 hypothetical protein LTR69_003381 [Exophiala sideris]KAK5185708.1 hypothetical protein LTR44_001757 [Eurotiomycetes sp. CCFEE 6388]